MRKIITAIALLCCVCAQAQTPQQLRDSLSKVSQRLSFKPDSIDLRLKKASLNVQLEQWDYALDEYDYVLDHEPDNIAALFYRAFVNEKKGRYNFARLDYQNLLKRVPGNFEGQLGLALLNQKDSHLTDAYDMINNLVNQYPDSAVAYAARAGIEEERGLLSLSEYDYGEAIKRDTKNTDYIISRANIRIKMNNSEQAKDDLDSAVRLGVPKSSLITLYNKCKK
jgi:Tfp pilus assembly protein PilF